ncbi:biotin carboxylase N-terminal domain-containing protein [Noviherbaspirillum sp.]|uniref:ATP-binding protein n=1 Tax=Noviherbaspirillum sp. TaxID=1926288 RepID=UPI002B488EF8|nr:biotin carboxylase N-terminal domain-containing protein [Noviherbaspirillum sp.]HJV83400.1 biotin carboxylase N-terminal domain-containing protein [Noviherbaspirillum sp.]
MTAHRFNTILIANRGEIALRVIRSARRLGYRTVAVYSDADRNAPHARAADLAVHLGASQPSVSYLNIAAIVDAARRSGAQAVHPGYGFLAENPEFANACMEAGLCFIGPTAWSILSMGNKAGAKRLMKEAGVPCVPGYLGADQSDARMLEEARLIGYPVMIKAASGGGGRGMRRVDEDADFVAALHSARSEAENAFGSGELILEKAIVEPRHIEIQVFADQHGNVVHLGERDCSVQRRHQKLIEESPSPVVTPALRAQMGAVSVAAAKAIDYVGAGTLEFLLDRDGNFYFMEMNTRLQVEHAVTEAVVGVDLVEWQLLVAQGGALPLRQEEIDARLAAGGHAIEVRLCAEDPGENFLPQSGAIAYWKAPSDLRCDHALESGLTISPYYDSMVAKLIAHGSDRADARRRLGYGLDECILLGVKTNRHFLSRCMRHAAFVDGHATTAFIETFFPSSARAPSACEPVVRHMAAALLALQQKTQLLDQPCYPAELHGWSSSCVYPQHCRFLLDGEALEVLMTTMQGGRWQMHADGEDAEVVLTASNENDATLQIDGRACRVSYASTDAALYFVFDGIAHTVRDTTYAPPVRDAAGSTSGRITAPMNGQVVAVHVQLGEGTAAGQALLVIEAMKMEHCILSPLDGEVVSLHVQIGDQVAPGQVLVELSAAQ